MKVVMMWVGKSPVLLSVGRSRFCSILLPFATYDGIPQSGDFDVKSQSELLLHSPLSPHCHKDTELRAVEEEARPQVCSVWRMEKLFLDCTKISAGTK